MRRFDFGFGMVDQVVVDSRRVTTDNALFVALKGSRTDGHNFLGSVRAKYALIDESYAGVEPEGIVLIRCANPFERLQELAAQYRESLNTKVVAIIGSHGKTMVKDLLFELLSREFSVTTSPESFNSQLGVALTLFEIEEEEYALVEAGVSVVGDMAKQAKMIEPDHVIVTNIGHKHLAHFKSREGIAKEFNVMLRASGDWVLTPRDPELEPKGWHWDCEIETEVKYLNDLFNTCSKAAQLLGVSEVKIEDYNPEPIRREIWRTPDGPLIINDKYSADPLSIEEALQRLQTFGRTGKCYFVYGGIRGGKEYKPCLNGVEHCFCDYPTMEEAIEACAKVAGKEDTVLIKGAKKIPLGKIAEIFSHSEITNQCTIHLTAIEQNLAMIRSSLPESTRLMVMLKALGYGTDDIQLAKFLELKGIDILGVAHVDEAIRLRRAGAKQDLFVLHTPPFEAEKLAHWGFETAVSSREQIEALAATKKRVKVHLHLDTGMKRLGCHVSEARELCKLIEDAPQLELHGIMTHFAAADDPEEDAFTERQIETLEAFVKDFDVPWIHASNTSAVLRFKTSKCNMVRIGLGMFGLYPSKATERLALRPALSLTSKVVGFNVCHEGESVGYSRAFRADRRDLKIAVVPLGYSDGMHRKYKLQVTIRGQKASIVGNICMDFMMVDVTEIDGVEIGDSVLIFGQDPFGYHAPAEEVAGYGETIPYELIACLGPRIQRVLTVENSV